MAKKKKTNRTSPIQPVSFNGVLLNGNTSFPLGRETICVSCCVGMSVF